jgi:hypothetical protein
VANGPALPRAVQNYLPAKPSSANMSGMTSNLNSIDYLSMNMTSNGKTLNYKIVDLVESYNFHIKFTSIRVHAKKLTIF